MILTQLLVLAGDIEQVLENENILPLALSSLLEHFSSVGSPWPWLQLL